MATAMCLAGGGRMNQDFFIDVLVGMAIEWGKCHGTKHRSGKC